MSKPAHPKQGKAPPHQSKARRSLQKHPKPHPRQAVQPQSKHPPFRESSPKSTLRIELGQSQSPTESQSQSRQAKPHPTKAKPAGATKSPKARQEKHPKPHPTPHPKQAGRHAPFRESSPKGTQRFEIGAKASPTESPHTQGKAKPHPTKAKPAGASKSPKARQEKQPKPHPTQIPKSIIRKAIEAVLKGRCLDLWALFKSTKGTADTPKAEIERR